MSQKISKKLKAVYSVPSTKSANLYTFLKTYHGGQSQQVLGGEFVLRMTQTRDAVDSIKGWNTALTGDPVTTPEAIYILLTKGG